MHLYTYRVVYVTKSVAYLFFTFAYMFVCMHVFMTGRCQSGEVQGIHSDDQIIDKRRGMYVCMYVGLVLVYVCM